MSAPLPAPATPVSADPVVLLEGVSKTFRYRPIPRGAHTLKTALLDALLGRRPALVTVEALQDVSFSLAPGESLGVIGANGAGKSTLLRLLAGVYRPDRGRLEIQGQIGRLLELGSGFHPELSGAENAEILGLVAGLSRSELRQRLDEIAEFAGLSDCLEAPVRTYSSGMVLRLGFAVATAVRPDLLVVDEILAVGDQPFQERCLARIAELRADGAALVTASHSLELVESHCQRALWLERGRVRALGPAGQVCQAYREQAGQSP